MGHRNASGPMDGVGKPVGAAPEDIKSLSDLRQVHWCTDRHMLPYWFQKTFLEEPQPDHLLRLPRNGGGGLTGGALLNLSLVLPLGVAHAIMLM